MNNATNLLVNKNFGVYKQADRSEHFLTNLVYCASSKMKPIFKAVISAVILTIFLQCLYSQHSIGVLRENLYTLERESDDMILIWLGGDFLDGEVRSWDHYRFGVPQYVVILEVAQDYRLLWSIKMNVSHIFSNLIAVFLPSFAFLLAIYSIIELRRRQNMREERMVTQENFAMLFFICWMLSLLFDPFITASDYFSQSYSTSIYQTLYFHVLMFYSSINIGIGGWLYSLSRKEEKSKWAWGSAGLVYGVLAIILYFLRRPTQNQKQPKLPHGFFLIISLCGILIIIALLSNPIHVLFLSYDKLSLFPEAIRQDLIASNFTRRILSMSMNTALALWMLKVLKQHHVKTPWVWSTLAFVFGIISPILYFSYRGGTVYTGEMSIENCIDGISRTK